MPTLFFDAQQSLGFMTITTNRLLCALLRRRMVQEGIDLTAEQWGVLAKVWNQEGLSQDELARFACVEKSSMSRVLAVLERKGLLERRPDPGDARRKNIFPTAAADAIKERCRDVVLEFQAGALRNVRPADWATCMDVLHAIKDTLLQDMAAQASPQDPAL